MRKVRVQPRFTCPGYKQPTSAFQIKEGYCLRGQWQGFSYSLLHSYNLYLHRLCEGAGTTALSTR